MLLQLCFKSNDDIAAADIANVGEGSITGGRAFSPSVMTSAQWRPQNLNAYQIQNESAVSTILFFFTSSFSFFLAIIGIIIHVFFVFA